MAGTYHANTRKHPRQRAGRAALRAATAIVLGTACTLPALAQDASEEAASDDSQVLDTVVVKGFRQSFANSLEIKRNADQVVDAISAEEMGQFPDQNVTEAVQRIAGVQITRNNGEGESVNIRGLSADFTRVEIDGRSTAVTIDSSDPGRASVLSVFASDLYNSIEVIKSPTAADIEGGVGGIVRLKTPNPLDVGERRFGFETGITSADTREDVEPLASVFYSDVLMDGRLGILLSGTWEKRDRSLDKIQSNQDWLVVDEGMLDDDTDPDQLALVGARYPGRLRQEIRKGDATKMNLNGKLQYMVTSDLELFANGVYTLEQRDEDRSRIQVQFSRGSLLSGTVDEATGTLMEGEFEKQRTEFLQFHRDTDIETKGLSGGFRLEKADYKLRGEVNYASSEEDLTEYKVSHRTNKDGVGGYSIVNDPEYPELYTAATESDYADLDLRELSLERRVISIDETGLRLDGERFVTAGPLTSLKAGLRFASTDFNRKQGQISSDVDGLTYADGVAFLSDAIFADGYGGSDLLRTWPSINPVQLYNLHPAEEAFSFNDENLYLLTEETQAGYALANYETDRFFGLNARGNLGVRIVKTIYEGEGAIDLAGDGIDDFGNIGTRTLDRDYTDVLPAFNLILSQDEDSDLIVRAAVSRALSRPSISEIQPGLVVRVADAENDGDPDTYEGTFEEGNPDLDPFLAWQYDLGLEWYFGDTGENAFTAALFYKDVENFIITTNWMGTYQNLDYGIGTAGPIDIINNNYAVNGGKAEVKGFELGVQMPLTFLPGYWSGLGMAANYTYTDSEFTDPDGNTQPFPGASENSFNLVGYYERGIFSGRLAYNYRDEYLIVPGSEEDGEVVNAQYGDAQGRLDTSIRLRFKNGVNVSFDALNLTEEQNYKYYDNTQRLEDLEVEGRIYSVKIGFIY